MRSISLALLIALCAACSYDIHEPATYAKSGVAQLYDYPRNGTYQSLGTRAWGFYRPSFAEPGLADVWDDIATRVRAMGGNACIVRYQKVNGFTARNIDVTCEVLNVSTAPSAAAAAAARPPSQATVGVAGASPTAPPTAPAPPSGVEFPTAPPPDAKAPVELRYAIAAEDFAKRQQCAVTPKPVLNSKTPGAETYTVACASGEALTIRCEFGNCRALR